MSSFSLKEYKLFAFNGFQQKPEELKSDIWHVLSYQKYCYDEILGYKVKIDYHHHLIKFMKDMNLFQSLNILDLNEEEQYLLKKKFEFEKINDLCPKKLAKVLWTYIEPMNDDLRFNMLAFDYLKMHVSIMIIDNSKDQLSDLDYVFLTKLINSSVDSWAAQLRELTIDFNLIIQNVYKLLPRRFLKIH